MNTKKLIESIIEDLVNDTSISKIMLKAQAIAYALGNDDFQQWVYREQMDIVLQKKYLNIEK